MSIFLLLFSALLLSFSFFFFNDTATTEIYTLSLHDALPISRVAAAELPDSADCVMNLRAVSCHRGLASPSVDGTPLASAMRDFDTPGSTRRLSESHP